MMSSMDPIVISGMSGRFPRSDTIDQFADNLLLGRDMITDQGYRWPQGLYGMSNRMGRIEDYKSFDAKFFGFMESNMVENMHPQERILFETTYEAILDAGVNPQTLRGTRTGVYIGHTNYCMDGYPEEIQPDLIGSSFLMGGLQSVKSLYANNLSYIFDFKGPSYLSDTACSSSLVAFTSAVNDFLLGYIDYAIVGGTQMLFEPFLMHLQEHLGLLSPRGVSAGMDESADGFVKGEGVACLFLQRKSTTRRVYASVLSSRINIDGAKKMGMARPSSQEQENLMVMTYKDAGIDPLKLTYFEAHCTGTKAGDPEEMRAIYNAYCARPGRTSPLPIGVLKNSMGHSEGCSGIAAIIKVLITYENQCIAPNINIKNIKHELKEYCPPLLPTTTKLEYSPGMAAVNNFGIGGVNGHVIVEPNYKLSKSELNDICGTLPRIVNVCGRTEESVSYLLDFIQNNPLKANEEFLALLTDCMKHMPQIKSAGFPYRGSLIIKKVKENNGPIYAYERQVSELKNKSSRPIWFLFPGLGGQWTAMAKALMSIQIFADKVEECHEILKRFGIDLKHLLLSEDKSALVTMKAKFVSTTAIEIVLFELIKALGIVADGIIGHSFGEIACAYADGCLTTEEALAVSHFRGQFTEGDHSIPKGVMAVCALSQTEASQLVLPEVVIGCINGKNTVVLSGPTEPMRQVLDKLKSKDIFFNELDCSQIPYHSHHLQSAAQPMTSELKKYIPNPKKRTEKWVSTSMSKSDPSRPELDSASPEYFVYNLLNPVYFYNKLKEIPSEAIVLEIAPSGIFREIVNETIDAASYLTLIKKDSNHSNLDHFMSTLAKLYELGLNPSIEKLYPLVQWPVSRGTQSISSLIKWDHSVKYNVTKYPDLFNRATASDMNQTVDISLAENSFYIDHNIDGDILFPGAGFLMLAWRQLAAATNEIWNQVPVVFEDIQLKRAVFLNKENKTKLKVKYSPNSGYFCILENGEICCNGKIRCATDESFIHQSVCQQILNEPIQTQYSLKSDDIYKEFGILGYDFGKNFRRLMDISTDDFQDYYGICNWNGNFITFLDGLLQSMCLAKPTRNLALPVLVKKLTIDPMMLMEELRARKILEGSSNDHRHVNSQVGDDEDVMNTFDHLTKKVADSFCKFEANIPFTFNIKTKTLICKGIELEDIVAFSISRKADTKNLVLDSYEFVPHYDSQAIDKKRLEFLKNYIEVCKAMTVKLKQSGLNDQLVCDFNYELPSNSVIDEIKHDHNKNLTMLKTFDKINMYLIDNSNNNSPVKLGEYLAQLCEDQEFNTGCDIVNQVSKNDRLFRTLIDTVTENMSDKTDLNVTEINLTADILAEQVTDHISNLAILRKNVNYNLIVKSIENVQNDELKKSCKIWNTKDNLDLRVTDLTIVRDSPDLWQLDLDYFLSQIFDMIGDRGFLIFIAKFRYTEPENVLNNLMKKWSSTFNNINLQQRIDNFVKLCESIGLSLLSHKSDAISTAALLFKKCPRSLSIPQNNKFVKITRDIDERTFDYLKNAISVSKESEDSKPIWLVANDSPVNGLMGFMKSLVLESGCENVRCIHDMDSNTDIDWDSKQMKTIIKTDLIFNVVKNGEVGAYRHLRLPDQFDMTQSDEYFLNISNGKESSGLQWFDSRKFISNTESYDLRNNRITEVPIAIYSSGIIFHDVLAANGRIPIDPAQNMVSDCVLGCEFAGRRTDTGQRVMGYSPGRCFASTIKVNTKYITEIPDHWSMNDSLTIGTSYYTVWYSLIKRANVREGESILIHSAAGGLGQAAINVAKHYKCQIYATISNDEKKAFLMNEFGIPEERIFNSRNCEFKRHIMRMTNGHGVDIVMNSLIGERMDATYQCLADMGRIIELGKFESVQNKQIGMFDFLRDISIIGVAVEYSLFFRQDCHEFFDWMHQNCNNGCIRPFKCTVFGVEEADRMFRFMTTGRHIGKLVLQFRKEEEDRTLLVSKAPILPVYHRTYFNPNKVYIITGGLGGFGLELIQWMIQKRARKFVVTSRNGITTEYQNYIVNRLKAFGRHLKFFNIKIQVSVNDCLTADCTQQVIREAQEFGQIGGLFHLSLVLRDSMFDDITYDNFRQPIDTKYTVLSNFDRISRQLDYFLDYFVVFSSLACGKGNIGQTNYALGNSLCEKLCEQRRRDGLHGLAIQYGPVGDVGAVARMEGVRQSFKMSSLAIQRINSCCDVLDVLLAIDQSVVTSYIKSDRTVEKVNPKKKSMSELWNAMGIDPERTPEHLTLGEIGMESMVAIKLQQEIEKEFNFKVSINLIKTMTVKMLREYENGNEKDIKAHIEQIKTAIEHLVKFKFIVANQTSVRLNEVRTGKPVYVLPPMEISFAAYEGLAKTINRPVIGLNWTKELMQIETIEDLSVYFHKILCEIDPNKSHELISHFDGSLVAYELWSEAMINKAVVVDVLTEERLFGDENLDQSLILYLFGYLFKNFPKTYNEQAIRELNTESDTSSKIRKIVSKIKDIAGRRLIAPDLEFIFHAFVKRGELIQKYKNQMKNGSRNMKLKGNGISELVVIKQIEKTDEPDLIENKLKNIYKTTNREDRIKFDFVLVDDNLSLDLATVGPKLVEHIK